VAIADFWRTFHHDGKISPRNKKRQNPSSNIMFFFVFYCCCALKYQAAANFLIGGRESFEKWPWFLANVAVNACQDLATLVVLYTRKSA
jgi:hypothetical protein